MGSSGGEEGDLIPEGQSSTDKLKSSCSLWSVATILVLVFVICLLMLVLFRVKNIDSHSSSWKFWQKNIPTQGLPDPLTSQFSNYASGESVTVKITEADLAGLINIAGPEFPLKKPSLKIQSDKIVLSGKTGNSFLAMSVDIGLLPKAKDGKLVFEITEMKAAGVPAPSKINQSVSGSLSSYLTVNSFGDINVTDASLSDGCLLLSGTKK